VVAPNAGSFWTCPKCRKHVPSRLQACRCGFDRGTGEEPVQEVSIRASPEEGEGKGRPWFLWLIVGVALVGIGYVIGKSPASTAPDPALVQKFQQIRNTPPPPPNVQYLPQPARIDAPPVSLQLESTQATPAIAQTHVVEPPPVSRQVITPPPVAEPPAAAPALPQETEVDLKRRVGTQDFDRHVAFLAAKADQADVAWQRFLEGCRQNVTSATAVAGVADRDWLVLAGVNVTTSTWTEACAEAGTFLSLMKQVRDGMCVAEDQARQSWVYPGVRRDIRHRHRLDWDGWDSACR
jgi:hypothetical protein